MPNTTNISRHDKDLINEIDLKLKGIKNMAQVSKLFYKVEIEDSSPVSPT